MKLCLRCNQYFDDPVEKCPTDGAILEGVGKDPLIGALINNRYLVDSVIGKGSSGIVYKARRLGRGEVVVAIKVLHSYIGAAGSSLDRFLREAQAASKLRNPHIITIWESGVTEDGQPYFVMDYLEGTTLGHIIKDKGHLEPKRVLSLLHQMCEALAEAHRQDIVHRDLKPENVVLHESDHGHDYIKLLDFGIADSPQHAQSSFQLEKPRTVSGSPAYMSPEQCQGLELDARSDIYSLAIVVFEMLTGKRPFPQKDNVNVMVLHVNEPPMTLTDVRPDLKFPQSVENTLARALSKRPADRQSTVQEFLLEFELAWQDGDNPLSASLNTIAQTSVSTANSSVPNTEEKHESEITADDLVIHGSEGSLAAWGNVSIQSSGKTALILDNNSSLNEHKNGNGLETSDIDIWKPESPINKDISPKEKSVSSSEKINMEATANNIQSLSPLPMPEAVIMSGNIETGIAEPSQSSTRECPDDQKPLSESKSEQSLTSKNRTIERLMEAAKKGQSTSRPLKIPPTKSEMPVPPMQSIRGQQTSEPTPALNAIPSLEVAQPTTKQPDGMIPRSELHKNINQSGSATPSGWYPISDEKPVSSIGNSNIPTSPILASNFATPTPQSSSIPQSSSSLSDSLSSLTSGKLSGQYNQPHILAEPPIPAVANKISAHSGVADLKSELKYTPVSEKTEGAEIYIKQKYRSTLSRLRVKQKSNRFDNSLITTRARAAALKADTAKPPVNLWHIAIVVVVCACLLASAYVVYSALTVPVAPVTSIETLLASGNYQQVMDILEGKSLSMPLDDKEKDQLNYAYLALAKSYLAKAKPDQALSFLVKINPSSSEATEANKIKEGILQQKKLAPKK